MKLFLNKKFNITYKIIKYTYIFILCIFILFLIFKRITLSNDLLGYRLYNINSIIDNYKIGDIVITKEVSLKTINIGDYIVSKDESDVKNDIFIIGRIKDIKYDLDNKVNNISISYNNKIDKIDSERVIGKIIGRVPIISCLYKLFSNIYLFIISYILPIIVFIIMDYLFRYYRKKSEEIDVI